VLRAAHEAVTPDTIVKFLFTSGSTGSPKAVINTHRMLCSNQAMLASGFAFVTDEPPVVVDWLPWSHTFGSNHNFNMVLTCGGSLYIDDGNPTPPGVPKTVRNLREIAPTIYFNVPKGYEALIRTFVPMRHCAAIFSAGLKVLFYAGAGLNQTTWDELTRLAVETTGERIIFLSSLGSTGDLASCASPARGISTAPATSAFRRRALSSSWCRTKGSWRRGCAARTSRPDTGDSTI
jgi:feruloyl-CoA synthase